MRIYYTLEGRLRSMMRRISILERKAGKPPPVPKSMQVQEITTENLDSLMTTGLYAQGLNGNASSARNYPFNRAGELTVVDARHVGAGFVYQTYQEYGRSGYSQVRRAWRSWYDGSWSAWRIIGQNQITASGTSVFQALGSGWSLQKASVVENAGVAHVFLAVNRTGGAISSGAGGNIGDEYIGQFDQRYWTALGEDFDVLLTESGVQTLIGRIRHNGYLDLTHSTVGNLLIDTGSMLRCQFTVPISP